MKEFSLSPMLIDPLFRWTKRKAVALAGRNQHGHQILFHLLYGVHNRLLRWRPKSVIMPVHGIALEMPSEHLLPFCVAANPLQEQPIADLAARLAGRDGYLHAIDVGANIGDTVSFMAARAPGGTFLCIEGSERFLPYLRANTSRLPASATVFIEPRLLGDKDQVAKVKLDTQFGTGFLSVAADAKTTLHALDTVLEDGCYRGLSWNLLKLDTDGYDFSIMRGATRMLDRCAPAVFFEFEPDIFKRQGQDPMVALAWLAERGYSRFTMFTNFGERLLTADAKSTDAFRQLADYSATYRRIHYDVLAVTPRHEGLL